MLSRKMMRKKFYKKLKINRAKITAGKDIPADLVLDVDQSGFFLGLGKKLNPGQYIGKPAESDENVLVVGRNGCGKSFVLAKSSIETWRDPFLALDIKDGELSAHYEQLRRTRRVSRPALVFDPIKGMGQHYNPYELLNESDPTFVPYVDEIAQAIIPMPIDARDPYWIDMSRNLLCAAIAYYFSMGYNFSETMLAVQMISSMDLCKTISRSDCQIAKIFLNEIGSLKPEQRASIASELKRHTMVFATDPYIQEALSVDNGQDFQDLISWKTFTTDPDTPNVFLRLDQDKLEHWGGVIRLMLTQLVRHLERRPGQDTSIKPNMKPILLLLDEFPLLGRMDVMAQAFPTLRSRHVSLCLMIQSLAQLDSVYGKDTRKILVDNCQYKVMLQISDPECCDYFSKLIGNVPTLEASYSESYHPDADQPIKSWQFSKPRNPIVYPEWFSDNPYIFLHTPHGFCVTIKQPLESIIKNNGGRAYVNS